MRIFVKSKFLLPLAIFALIGSLGVGALVVSSQNVSARGEAESNDSGSGSNSGSGKSSSSSSSSSKKSGSSSSSSSSKNSSSSSSKKSSDDSSGGTFSTSTDNRRGATKPEDNGVDSASEDAADDSATGIDNRGGASKTEDNGIDDSQGVDNRGGANKNEDSAITAIPENRQFQGEDSVVHRSVVAQVVSQLHAVANREGGIGPEVRIVAQQQNDSKERALGAIEKVEKRGKLATFFFGADSEGIETLHSEIELTKKNETQLRGAAQKVENVEDRQLILSQADTLEKEAERMENIVEAHDNAFSMFGWVSKIF